ncbi:hypothetical protein N7G274_005657 [Stereocaulon virgatum]|uniref:PD-(D/E)XK nuclease-like domain-containing protein n=1 Tax=Stereocaulon virgatum TaxID=373712 RepID=A0ABR4A7I9_9LECA
MVKYRPVFEKLQEHHASHDTSNATGDSILSWLNTSCNSPSHFQDIAPPASPHSTSFISSPPATPPHLRKRKRPSTRKPLQPSNGNQGPPKSKRKMNNREDDAKEQLPRELRDKAGLRKPSKYYEEEQVLHSQTSLVRGLGTPQKREPKGRGRNVTSSQGRAIGSGQHLAGQSLVPYDIGPGNPTTPMKGLGRGTGSPTTRPQSPSKSSHASDRTGWMARLEPGVQVLSPEECLKDREITASARNFWLNYIGSDANDDFIPNYFREELIRQEMTPNKTKKRVPKESFTDLKDGWYGNFHQTELDFLFKEACDVIKMARKYRNTRCTEAHWMAVVVHPLLRILRRLAKYGNDDGFEKLEVADMTSVNLNPYHAPKDPNNDSKPLNKRIDGALGLSLTSVERDFLIRANYNDTIPSINPINGEFGAFNPFFAHIEIKLPYTDRAPGPKLGTWAAAEFSKRELEGYSLDMPIVSISIIGDNWELWVAYPEGFGEGVPEDVDYGPCVLMGPVPIGNTTGIRGVFEILQFLCQCADWGLNEYRAWFEREILRKHGFSSKEERVKGKIKA